MKKIDAINKIENVGKFQNCQSGGLQFAEDTIIYGRNTQGKSTLTSIFRSLKSGNPKIVEGRKTFGCSTRQQIEIRFKDGTTTEIYQFPSAKWNSGFKSILIFDAHFISENIFEGERISYDQQKSLNQIIIGDHGLQLNHEINNLQKDLDELTNKKRQLTNTFSKLIPAKEFGNIDLENFCALPELQEINIDTEISELKNQIELTKNRDIIIGAINNHISIFSRMDIKNIESSLTSTVKFNPATIDEHIKKHWNNQEASKDFLRVGLDLTKPNKDTCVFCGQDLKKEQKELLEVYSDFFKGEYEQLQKNVNSIKAQVDKWNIEKDFALLEADLAKYNLIFDFSDQDKQLLFDKKNKLCSIISEKATNLYYQPQDNLLTDLSGLTQKLVNSLKNLLSTKFPNDSKAESVGLLQSKLKKAELNKKRFEEEFKKLCNEFAQNNSAFNAKRTLREQKRKDLEVYSTEIFSKHATSINKFLGKMGADFKIEDMEQMKNIIGQSERLFTIVFFNSHKVKIDETNEAAHSFKNTLSESDKRLLAFAFFLSILSLDSDLDRRIIIFDDPFSSFDEERKRTTIFLLADIGYNSKDTAGATITKKPLQKIILTHEKYFFREIYVKAFSRAQTLKIEYAGEVNGIKSCKLSYCKVEEDFPNDEIISKIVKVRGLQGSKNSTHNYQSDCRIILENIFKHKYYFELSEHIANKRSVRTFVLHLQSRYTENDFNRLSRLCDDLNIELHDNTLTNSNGDHEAILKDFFTCLEII